MTCPDCTQGVQTLPYGPKRIQRKRTKGWRMPLDAVYVGRGSRWGNPVHVGNSAHASVPSDEGYLDGVDLVITPAIANVFYRWLTVTRLQDPAGPDPHPEDVAYTEEWRRAIVQLRGRDLVCWCPLDAPCHADVLLEIANA